MLAAAWLTQHGVLCYGTGTAHGKSMSRRFGRYLIRDELTDELGRGAFGRVYRAFDPNVNRYVAIKVLSSGSDPDLLSRFQDESKTAGQLEHENIVKVYDFDLQDGVPYLVMELLDGETLETIIETQKVSGRPIQLLDKVEIMFQVAKGLQYAHSENVIHRDIKPGNIMVLPTGTVKVMDFGIARVMDKDGTRRTRQGDIAGTILYMAPEQFSGRDADKRTDIFAYADVYYELLTGEHPFFGKDFATAMYCITANEPRPIREKLPECPAALENMIHRLLVKDPEVRPERLDEVVLDTQPVLQHLRRERAVIVAAEIEPLIKAGDLERALIAIRQVLQLDPLNQVANRCREQIQQERERKAMRLRAAALARAGHEQVAARRFKEALQSFQNALRLDPTNPETQALVDQVQVTLENVRTAGRLVAEARTDMEQGQLEGALDKATRAAELDAASPEASQLCDRLHQEIQSRREAALLAGVEGLCNSGDYDAAVAVLSEAEAAGRSSPGIAAYRTRVERERAEAEKRRRQARFAAGLAKAREALYDQRLQEACDGAEALCAEYPEEASASELLSEVREYQAARRRLEAINQATQAARLLIKEKRLNDAREVLESGLRAYPRDTSISRLMELVNTLAVAQERARVIGQAIRQAHSLAEAGQLDEALRMVNGAIVELGEDPSLVECKRNFELERDQRDYTLGLQARLEQGRQLLTQGNPAGAIDLLENAMLHYPGEPELSLLLSSARGALTALRELGFVKHHRAQVAALEAADQYTSALALMEAALARYPGNADLLDTAARLRQKIQEQEAKRLLVAHVRRVEDAIQAGDWDAAAGNCDAAQRDFPREAKLAEFSIRIREAQRQLAISQLQAQVRGSLAQQDLDAVERQLAATRQGFSQDAVWQTLLREFERYRAYHGDLKRAAEACAAGTYDHAEELLLPWLDEAPDPRAAKLFETASEGRREAQERDRRQQEDATIAKGRSDADALVRQGDYTGAIAMLHQLAAQYPGHPEIQRDQEAAAQALERQLREEAAAIAKGRSDADALSRRGDYPGAIAMLDELAGQHPGHPEIQQDREAAAQALERQRRQAEERARRQQEDAAVAKGRSDAVALIRRGDYPGAIAMLDELAGQYPRHAEIQQDREAAAQALESQRRQAAEQARRQHEDAAVAKGRSDAEALVRRGDYPGAIAMLDELAGQYPGHPEIQEDREAAAQALERQRHAAELARRQQEEMAVAKGRSDADALVRQGHYRGAIAILDQLAAQYPNRSEIRQDRETAARELDRQHREAEAATRRQQDAAFIAGERQKAAALVQEGNYKDAVAALQQLALVHPGHSGIQQDMEAARRELDRQCLEAAEQVRRQEQAVIAGARTEAAALIERRDYAGAMTLLGRLAKQFPGHAEIEQDRDSAAHELERIRVELAIAEDRRKAAVLAEKADYTAAIGILRPLSRKHPDHSGIQGDLDAAKCERERQRHEAEERTRRQRREEAIAQGRQDSQALISQGAYDDAIATLDRLTQDYGTNPEIEQDRQTALAELERQRREADEQSRRRREEGAIAKTRHDAAALIEKGDCRGAIRVLDWLANQYPGYPGIQQDREAAQQELERQRWEAEELARRQREEAAIAEGRTQAAALTTAGDDQGALALLDRLANQYPGHLDIQRDRKAVQREVQHQLLEAEEQARRQREEAAVAKARGDAAALAQNGDYQGALALLDWLGSQFPGHPAIQQDRQTLGRQWEKVRREAEELARRQLELLALAKARQDAAAFIRKGDFQGATAILDRLAVRYPGDVEIRADRDAAAAALQRQRREMEDRAKRALAVVETKRKSASEANPLPVRPVHEDAEQRARRVLVNLPAGKRGARDQAGPAGVARLSNWSRVSGIWKSRSLYLERIRRALVRFVAGVLAEGRRQTERLRRKMR